MAKHSLHGGGSIDVKSVSGIFHATVPTIERMTESNDRFVRYSTPKDGAKPVKITFKFTTTNCPGDTKFGIKQFIYIDWMNHSYKGLKNTDGWIWQSYKGPRSYMLDVSASKLEILFQPRTDLPTGAKAAADHAPFYDRLPIAVTNNTEVEMSIEDGPGAALNLDMRNIATDRQNNLDSINVKQTFLTVLTEVSKGNVHTPIEAAYWQQVCNGTVTWDKAEPNFSQVVSVNKPLGQFPNITSDFLVCDYFLLTDTTLDVSDCMVQRMNDALYTVRGMYKKQNFSGGATHKDTSLNAKGYEIVQYNLLS